MNILIVDDQPNVISSLLQRVPWQGIGVSNVYTASSTMNAREILFAKQIDILLADIEMPQENGLSLVQWARGKRMDMECILLTSHANFYYAQMAISLEICDYVIQPAATEDIVRAIKKAEQRLLQKRQMNQRLHFQGFLSSAQNEIIRNFFDTLPMDFKDDPRIAAQLKELGVPECWDGQAFLFLAKLYHWNKLPPPFLEFFEDFQNSVHDVFSFLQAPALSFYPNESCIYTVLFAKVQSDQKTHMRRLQQQVLQKNGCSLSLFYCSTTMNWMRVSMLSVNRAMENSGKRDEGILQEVMTEKDYQQLSPSRNYEKYFEQLRDYVISHLDSPLSRDLLAKELGISPDHLSHVVYQILGCSLKSFITQERMNNAKELLHTTNLSIGEISAACGYDSPAYFSKVYRETFQRSPREERKKQEQTLCRFDRAIP